MNWPLLGTSLFLRAMITQKRMTKITETMAINRYLSSHGTLSNNGGSSKLETPGAWKPSDSSPPVSSGTRPKITPLTSPSCRSRRYLW